MVLTEIMESNATINAYYRDSKLPAFIKKAVCTNRRKKLREISKKYSGLDGYSYEDIKELAVYCHNNYPPAGHISHVYSVGIVPITKRGFTVDFITMDLTYTEGDTTFQYSINLDEEFHNMDIRVTTEIKKAGKKIHSNALQRKSLVPQTTDSDVIKDLLGGLASLIGEVLDKIIEESIQRSERIYDL